MTMRFRASLFCLATTASFSIGADWTQFRGPNGSGVSTETNLPNEWTSTKNIAWKVNVPGVAWSCPIIVKDQVFVTTAVADGQPKPGGGGGFGGGRPGGGGGFGGGRGGPDKVYTWKVLCLDRKTGKEIWSKTAAEGKPKYGTHGSNTFATETPVSDGTNIYAYFAANGTVVAYDFTGKELWKKNIGAFPSMANWGTASSPAVDNGKVFIQCDNEEKSFVIALDAKTGEQAWKVNRSEKTSWSTPYIWKTKKRTELVLLGGNKAIGYNPENGKVIWELAIGGGGQCNTTPVGDEERLYIGSSMGGGGSRPGGFGGGRPGGSSGSSSGASNSGTLFAVNAGAEGEINTKPSESNKNLAWSAPKAMPSAASPVIYNGYLYTFDRQGGTVSCFNIKSGKAEYTKERIPNARAIWASPWAYDGKIFCLDESGTTHVLKAGATFEVVRTNALARDTYWSTPSIAGGNLFIRSVDGLTCIK